MCWYTPGIAPMATGSVIPSRTKAGRIRSAGSSRVWATMRRIAGVVRNRRGRAPGKEPYTVMRPRYARRPASFTDRLSAPVPPTRARKHRGAAHPSPVPSRRCGQPGGRPGPQPPDMAAPKGPAP
ncbi:hypothetical protein GCM10018987_69740 [Streptomyces cremeus]